MLDYKKLIFVPGWFTANSFSNLSLRHTVFSAFSMPYLSILGAQPAVIFKKKTMYYI